MLKIKTDDIAVGSAMPYQASMIDWLKQNEYQQNGGIISAIIGQYAENGLLACWGAIDSVIGSTHTITAGNIFYEGYFYYTSYSIIVLGPGEVVVGNIVSSFPNTHDPVTFSDSSTHNVHEQLRIVWSAGASGSGDFDFDALTYINDKWHVIGTTGEPTFQNGMTQYSGTNASIVAFKQHLNFVQLKGELIVPNTVTANSTIFTLPSGYYSTTEDRIVLALFKNLTTSEFGFCPLYITASGNVGVAIPFTLFAGNSLISLDGISLSIS
jgi:hypothetical protein